MVKVILDKSDHLILLLRPLSVIFDYYFTWDTGGKSSGDQLRVNKGATVPIRCIAGACFPIVSFLQ